MATVITKEMIHIAKLTNARFLLLPSCLCSIELVYTVNRLPPSYRAIVRIGRSILPVLKGCGWRVVGLLHPRRGCIRLWPDRRIVIAFPDVITRFVCIVSAGHESASNIAGTFIHGLSSAIHIIITTNVAASP